MQATTLWARLDLVDAQVTLAADLAIVTAVGAVTALISRRLGQSSILGYLVAGLIVGPYIPVPLFADPSRMGALAEVGVILVLFAVGLEFRIRRLVEILPISGLTAILQIATLGWVGHSTGSYMGWSSAASVCLGACLAISSTMVVSAVLRSNPIDPDSRSHVFGILIVQDVVAIVLIAIVTALAAGQTLELESVLKLMGKLGAVVVVMLCAGLLIVPSLVRWTVRNFDSEVLVVLIVGIAFGFAMAAYSLGFSVALGGFIAGMAVAESGKAEHVERNIEPLRALFTAIFFVSIGMTVDPRMAWDSMGLALALTALIVVAQLFSVTIGSVLTGSSLRRSVTAGLALGQIGELSFILASIAISGGVLAAETLSALVTAATITAFTTPLFLGRAQVVVHTLDQMLPDRVQQVFAVYQSFIRQGSAAEGKRALRGHLLSIVLDWAALLAIFVGRDALAVYVHADRRFLLSSGAAVLAVPFVVGLLRSGGRIVTETRQLTRGELGGSPRAKAVEALALLAVALSIGIPSVVVLQPFASGSWPRGVIFAVLLGALVYALLRFRKVRPGQTSEVAQLAFRLADHARSVDEHVALSPVANSLSGLDYQTVSVHPNAVAAGSTLAGLDLRCKTGATVVAISRGKTTIALPTGHDKFSAGDIVAISGSEEAFERARALFADSDFAPASLGILGEPDAADA